MQIQLYCCSKAYAPSEVDTSTIGGYVQTRDKFNAEDLEAAPLSIKKKKEQNTRVTFEYNYLA